MLAAIPFALLFASVIEAAPTTPSTVASYNGWDSQGCYVDSIYSRTMPVTMDTPGGPGAMTVELCLDACHNAGYEYAGLEWSQECYCGTSLPPQQATDGRCNMVCNGNSLEYCGGGNGLNVYQYTATNVQSYNSWSYDNCYVDDVNNRALPVTMQVSGGPNAMTVELCLDACHSAGYSIAGVEWSQECYCGNWIPDQVAWDDRCNMVCKGNEHEICGGGNGLSVYKSGPKNLPTYNSWTFSNCYVDSIWDRVLPKTMTVSGPMTIEGCLDACDAAGYQFAGVEYGQECYCGISPPPTIATDGRCDMACQGNSDELCGGGNGIDVYQSSKTHDGWNFEGCFVDSIDNRVLPICAAADQDPWMTIGKCLDACKDLGYHYAGLEYGHECWCGSSAPSVPATDGRCNMACSGDSHETCGGGNGIDVYHHEHAKTSIVTTFTTTTSSTATITTATTATEPVTGTTTVAEEFTDTTTITVPTTITTTIPVTVTGDTTVPVTTVTSVDEVITIIETVPVLTTLVSTIPEPTTLVVETKSFFTSRSTTFIPNGFEVFLVLESTTIPVTVSTTLFDFEPFLSTAFVPEPIITDTTSGIPTTIFDIEPFTSTSSEVDVVPTSTTVVTDFTTTTYSVEPYTTTGFDEETTTFTTVIAAPVTVTTTIVTAVYGRP